MDNFPLHLKISYNQRLDIQLFIRHQFKNEKFRRHWIFCKGYQMNEENKILKTFISFLNQGDLFRVKTSNSSIQWKQKIIEENIFSQTINFSGVSKKKFKLNLINQVLSIQEKFPQKQYDQLCAITIFFSQSLPFEQFQQIRQFFSNYSNSQFLINIFVPQIYIQKLTFNKAWIRTYLIKQLKQQLRGFFGSMNKISYKKVTIKLRSLQGDLVLNQRSENSQKSFWMNNKQQIYHNLYFPSSNSPYIMSVEIKNMLKTQICSFQIQLICLDEIGNSSKFLKTFSLRLKREFLDWDDDSKGNNDVIKFSKYQQLSLNFEQVNLNQKLNFMKIYGTPGRAILKNRMQV